MIEFQSERLGAVHKRVTHGFFGRRGGVSSGLYESLNCGPGSNDEAGNVEQNRALVAEALGARSDMLASVWQVHSDICVYIDEPLLTGDLRPKADALVTDKAGLALGVLTADCGPVLYAGLKSDGAPIIGAAHSGWGGAIKGINEATIDTMIKHGAVLESMTAVIGPCIAQSSYEVSMGFETPFMEQDEQNEHFFKSGAKEGYLMFDLSGYIASRIALKSVKNVVISGIDTYGEAERFFSYRRTTHNKEPDYGRQIAAICIDE